MFTIYKNKRNNFGFTLIELMVVMSIISLMSSIVLSALSNARAKARDGIRLQDMRTLQTAIAMYRSDNNDKLPLEGNDTSENSYNFSNFLSPLTTGSTKYIQQKISDPINNGIAIGNYFYLYSTLPAFISYNCLDKTAKASLLFKLEKMTTSYSPCQGAGAELYSCICLK